MRLRIKFGLQAENFGLLINSIVLVALLSAKVILCSSFCASTSRSSQLLIFSSF